ncbi:hypothetical protein OVV54_25745, partial [Klebsiella pneumoniae]|nr:hypothetical protein [Klebsiella pneumoniae]
LGGISHHVVALFHHKRPVGAGVAQFLEDRLLGARIIATLISALQTTGGTRGLASLCIGGGEATAVAVELMG